VETLAPSLYKAVRPRKKKAIVVESLLGMRGRGTPAGHISLQMLLELVGG
jgi:hypothetical protein